MLSHWVKNPDSGERRIIRSVARKGRIPKTTLRVLYFPVRCIMKPAKRDPSDIETEFGARCAPVAIEGNDLAKDQTSKVGRVPTGFCAALGKDHCEVTNISSLFSFECLIGTHVKREGGRNT